MTIAAIVDSGADTSLLPLGIARRLGIDSRLTEQEQESQGIEAKFQTWKSNVSIHAQVLAATERGLEPWGPEIQLDPAFAETEDSLLGRADFFRSFAISFECRHAEAWFRLEI